MGAALKTSRFTRLDTRRPVFTSLGLRTPVLPGYGRNSTAPEHPQMSPNRARCSHCKVSEKVLSDRLLAAQSQIDSLFKIYEWIYRYLAKTSAMNWY